MNPLDSRYDAWTGDPAQDRRRLADRVRRHAEQVRRLVRRQAELDKAAKARTRQLLAAKIVLGVVVVLFALIFTLTRIAGVW